MEVIIWKNEDPALTSHIATLLGLFTNPTHLAFGKQSLLGFIRKNALMTRDSHF